MITFEEWWQTQEQFNDVLGTRNKEIAQVAWEAGIENCAKAHNCWNCSSKY